MSPIELSWTAKKWGCAGGWLDLALLIKDITDYKAQCCKFMQVCDGVFDCPGTETTPEGEEEDNCTTGG